MMHESTTNPGKKRFGAAKHFLEYRTSESEFDNLKIQLIESVNILEKKFWQHEKH